MNPYNEWKYWNGVLGIAFFKMGEALNDPKYSKYAETNLQFIFDHYDLFKKMTEEKKLKGMEQLYRYTMLDDCGAMGAYTAMVYKNNNSRKDYVDYLKKTADYMLNQEVKLDDGTLARVTPCEKTLGWTICIWAFHFLPVMGAFRAKPNTLILRPNRLKCLRNIYTMKIQTCISIAITTISNRPVPRTGGVQTAGVYWHKPICWNFCQKIIPNATLY